MKHLFIIGLSIGIAAAALADKPAMPRDGSGLSSGEKTTFLGALGVTSFGRSLLDDGDAGTARATLGLGSASLQGINGPELTDSATETFYRASLRARLAALLGNNAVFGLIGDSISEAYGSTPSNSWFERLQGMINFTTGFGSSPEVTNFDDPTRYGLTYAGTYSTGSNGPVKSIVLTPGATITFTGNYAYLSFLFQRASGARGIEVRVNGTLATTIDCSGTAGDDISSGLFAVSGGSGTTYELKCVTGNVEITGLWRLVAATGKVAYFGRYALTSQSTTFFSPTRIASIIRHVTVSFGAVAANPTVAVALGTNNSYNATTTTSAAQYRLDLISIFAQLQAAGIRVFAIGLIEAGTGWTVQSGSWGDYAAAQASACAEMGVPLVSMNQDDFDGTGLLADHLHPNDNGQYQMLRNVVTTLTAPALSIGQQAGSLTWTGPAYVNSWTDRGGGFEAGAYARDRNGIVHVRGLVQNGSSNTDIFTFPVGFRPSQTLLRVAQTVTGSTPSPVFLQVAPTGVASILGTVGTYTILDCSFPAEK